MIFNSQSVSQSISQSVSQSVSQSAIQSVSQSAIQSVSQSAIQSVSQVRYEQNDRTVTVRQSSSEFVFTIDAYFLCETAMNDLNVRSASAVLLPTASGRVATVQWPCHEPASR